MSTYPLVNRRGDDLKYFVYHVDDAIIKSIVQREGFINKRPGFMGSTLAATIPGGYGEGTAPADYAIDLRGDRDEQWIMLEGQACVGPYKIEQGKHHVIVPGAPEGMVVIVEDLDVALQQRLDGVVAKSAPPAGGDDTDKVLLLVGSALLKGLTMGLASVGVPSELAGGMADMLGDLVDSGMAAPPPAPQLDQIKAAVKDVVNEASAKQSASVFTETLTWLTSFRELVADRKAAGGTVSDDKAKQFEAALQTALTPTSRDSFVDTLAYVRDNPEVAQYIIPSFIAAIGVFVQLKRIDLGREYLPERARDPQFVFPPSEITNFISAVNAYARGLEEAAKVFAATRASLVEDTRLNGTPEAIIPIKLISKQYLGDEFAARDLTYAEAHPNGAWAPNGEAYGTHPDLVEDALTSLRGIADKLADDLHAIQTGGWPTYLLDYRAVGAVGA